MTLEVGQIEYNLATSDTAIHLCSVPRIKSSVGKVLGTFVADVIGVMLIKPTDKERPALPGERYVSFSPSFSLCT
jgi:hypothetical protein